MQSRTVGRRDRHPGAGFLSGGLDGRLRAYSAGDGRIVWDVDTKGDYQTVNGVAAKGGSIDGGGAVVVDGMLYVSSGSGIFGGMPGNVLLAYSVDGLRSESALLGGSDS
jgi:polyvinyl alcohol dehydrogenase (cytochrome)